MATIKYNQFVKFVNDGKRARFGELTFQGDSVYSYNTLIAKVHRESREIQLLTTKFSQTTSCHQKAVSVGHKLLPAGWVLSFVSNFNNNNNN